MEFSATVTNADKIKLGIKNISQALPGIDLEDVNKAMKLAARLSVPYNGGNSYDVPESLGQKYIRTGNLGRSVVVYTRGATTTIEAKAYHRGREYTQYVIGDRNGENQAGVHAGRWVTMADAVNTQMETLIATLEADNQQLIDKELG